MIEVKLPNPLSTEERLRLTRLIEHDTGGYINELKGSIGVHSAELDDLHQKRLEAIVSHLSYLMGTVETLVEADEFSFDGLFSWSLYKCHCKEAFVNELRDLFPGNLPEGNGRYLESNPGKLQVVRQGFHENFLSFEAVLHSVLFNLIKNGLEEQENESARVLMNIRKLDHFPENALFIPEGSRDYTKFTVFDIYNSGEYSNKRPFEESLTAPPESSEDRGFGLYFVGLAAKVFRAPVSIKSDSERDSTQISFYHPVYCDGKES